MECNIARRVGKPLTVKGVERFYCPRWFHRPFLEIIVNQAFPFVILGAPFGSSAGKIIDQSGRTFDAVFIPEIAFLQSIFLAVMFQARREKVEPLRDIPQDMTISKQDWHNLWIIFIPILTILTILFLLLPHLSWPIFL